MLNSRKLLACIPEALQGSVAIVCSGRVWLAGPRSMTGGGAFSLETTSRWALAARDPAADSAEQM
jgi:hypothetical protein